jgi:HNH endonuclease
VLLKSIKPALERFWEKVEKNGPIPSSCPELGPCWMWMGSKDTGGYGWFHGKKDFNSTLAHKVSFIIYSGMIPQGYDVLHKCDMPPCVRPSHLFLGTARDNAVDMLSKGRTPSAKLNVFQVKDIITSLSHGVPGSRLAIIYGVSQATISEIKSRKIWTWISREGVNA